MNAFEIAPVQDDPAVAVIVANERINLGNTDALRELAEQAYHSGAHRLLLDLSATPSITSAGIRAVISIYKLVGGNAGFKLVSPSPDVRRTLEIAGMLDRIQVYDDLPSAMRSFS